MNSLHNVRRQSYLDSIALQPETTTIIAQVAVYYTTRIDPYLAIRVKKKKKESNIEDKNVESYCVSDFELKLKTVKKGKQKKIIL